MRILLTPFAIHIPSIDSLRLGNVDRLSEIGAEVRQLRTSAGVSHFGAGDRLKHIGSAASLAAEFSKKKVERYSFADTPDLQRGNPRIVWTVGIRRTLVTVTAACEMKGDELEALTKDLLRVNDFLLTRVANVDTAWSWSSIRVLGVAFAAPSPARDLGRVPDDAVVDVIDNRAVYGEEQRALVQRLSDADLPPNVARTRHGDARVIRWGDPSRERVETMLERRLAWISGQEGMPLDSSVNALGDQEFALWDSVQTSELTFYSAATGEGAKAVVFDASDDEDLVETVERLYYMVASGVTAEGMPLRKVTLITPSREAALALHPLASRYEMDVAYVGDDDRFWNPFPSQPGR